MLSLSIALPTHDMPDKQYFFKRCLDSLWSQTFQDFEIVVSDNSEDNLIWQICDYYGSIQYVRNPIKGMAQNTNETIKRAKGKLIKILYMDDFLNHNESLQDIVDSFKGQWLVTDCVHFDGLKYFNHHVPVWNDEIQTGKNTIGSPSVLTIKNENPMLFDESMQWLLDCDLYKRYYERYGLPVMIKDKNVVIGVGEHQMTNTMGEQRKIDEFNYMKQKYATA